MKHSLYFPLVFILISFTQYTGISQCTNTIKNPSDDVIAPQYNEPMTVAIQLPGQFYRIKDLEIGETYVFNTSLGNDNISIRDAYGLNLVEHGAVPLTFTVTGDDILTIHLCGSSPLPRTSYVTCVGCPAIPPGVGVGIINPEAVFDVDGEIKVSNSQSPPKAGMIRWNPSAEDFEGYNGTEWVSFTQYESGWGRPNTRLIEMQKSSAGVDGDELDQFGNSVCISGDYAIVGAERDNEDGLWSGSAYLYYRSGINWTKQAKITAGVDGDAEDFFGHNVSISGDYAIIGALYDDDDGFQSGSTYIYYRSGTSWTKQAKITAGSDGAAGDFFGKSVSISGDYAIIGAPNDDDDGSESGSAYIFHRSGTNWTKQAKLTAGTDGAANDNFGYSVSISGDYAIIGAHNDDDDGFQSGSAYIFHHIGTGWAKEAKIAAGSDGAANDNFGYSVSISANYAIIGAYGDDNDGDNSGSAYIYHRSGSNWMKQAKITAGSEGDVGDQFGNSVFISGDYVIVGAFLDDDDGSESGSVYIFQRSGTSWTKQTKLHASDGAANDKFGNSVSISGDYAIVGAPNDDDDGSESGSVYFFNQ